MTALSFNLCNAGGISEVSQTRALLPEALTTLREVNSAGEKGLSGFCWLQTTAGEKGKAFGGKEVNLR